MPSSAHHEVPAPHIEALILSLRGEKVLLDTDLARLYGVPTFRFNEAVKRNQVRFPADFRFQLSKTEWQAVEPLRSQFAILESEPPLASQNAISKQGRGRHRKYLPWAFTEHGALMAANVLNSPRAVEMSLYVIRAFVRIRRELATNEVLARRLAQVENTLLRHDAALRGLYEKLKPLLSPPPALPKPEIGFHAVPKALHSSTKPERGRSRTTPLCPL